MIMKLLSTLLLLALPSTLAYRTEGFPCRAHFQCQSSHCNSTLKCEPKRANGANCEIHEGCQSGRCSGGVCQLQRQVGEGPCDVHDDCYEGFCNATTAVCDAWKPKQDPCVDDFECRSGRCFANPPRCEFVIYEGAICGKNNDCHGDRCKMVTELGGDNRCYPRKWNNEACHTNPDCLSLRCETQNCTEPVWNGEPCDEPSDCYSLFCNKEKGCVATAEEADNDMIEADAPGIAGSQAMAVANGGGGSVDIESGTVFVSNGGNNGSGAGNEMRRLMVAALVGVVGAAVAVMV